MHKPSSLRAIALIPLLVASSTAVAEVNFEKQLWPTLEAKCVNCHRVPYEGNGRMKKPKAGLRLDGDWGFLEGSENGKVIEPGNSAESSLYEVVTLPEDDDMFMPPKGDAMTEEEITLLKTWIDEGAKFGDWKGSQEGRPATTEAAEDKPLEPKISVYDTLAKGMAPPAEDAIKAVDDAGGRVTALATGFPLVRVDFIATKETAGDEAVAALSKIAPNVAQLDLSNTKVGSGSLETIGTLSNLVLLDLHSTEISDENLDQLAGLKQLRYLNLYDTQVSDAGLDNLKKVASLEKVYLWQSKASKNGAAGLQKALPKAKVSFK